MIELLQWELRELKRLLISLEIDKATYQEEVESLKAEIRALQAH